MAFELTYGDLVCTIYCDMCTKPNCDGCDLKEERNDDTVISTITLDESEN